jgi:cytochrome b
MSGPQTPARWEYAALRLWHAALAGGFLVAYLSADEETYRMHVFAGYWVVTALAARLALPLIGTAGGPLSLPRPLSLARTARQRLFAVMGAALLALVGLAGVSGILADAVSAVEDLHEGLSNGALWLVAAHAVVVIWAFQGRRLIERLRGGPVRGKVARGAVAGLLIAACTVGTAQAGTPERDTILAAYAKAATAEDPAFSGFSAARGEALYRARNNASPELASCAACHTDDPTRPGRHAKTGREIPPAAVSANPKRFTDAEKVEERFTRDCKTVLGRACTTRDKGDFITFLSAK